MANYRDLIVSISPTVFRGYYGERLAGELCAWQCDLIAAGATEAVKSAWVKQSTNPDDSLTLLGSESLLEAYPGETPAQHRARIADRWSTWQFAGDESSIESQLGKAGYVGARVVFFADRAGPNNEPAPYWSQFWVYFPFGSHPVVSEGIPWDSFNWDDGTTWGPEGITSEFLATIRGIVRKFKPGHWICRGFIFQLNNVTWDSFNWDDGTTWGNEIEVEF